MFDWHDWIATHQATLKAIGLPADVYLSHEHWLDFLENGHLHWHPTENAGFEFSQLNDAQQRHLLRYLESEIEHEPFRSYVQDRNRGMREPSNDFPLLNWLRNRIGGE